MRSFIFEDQNDFPRMPDQFPYDEESGLHMNPITQWSKSPYLGAVWSEKRGSWVAQIHIPQDVWEARIRDNEKWHGVLADGFFNEKGNLRPTIRIPVKDPRQAAWIAQSVLYGPDDTGELIEDYLTARFIDGQPGRTAWADIYREMPKFQGAPLVATDAESWFAKHQERDKQTKLAKNTEIANARAPEKIKQGIINWITKGGNRKKIFGSAKLTLNQLGAVIDRAIAKLGVQYFMQGINVKDPAGFDLRQFVGESIEESTRLDQDFEADLRKYKKASGEERSKLEKKWGKRSVHFKESLGEGVSRNHALSPSELFDAAIDGLYNSGLEFEVLENIVGGNSCYMDFQDSRGGTYRLMIEKTGDL